MSRPLLAAGPDNGLLLLYVGVVAFFAFVPWAVLAFRLGISKSNASLIPFGAAVVVSVAILVEERLFGFVFPFVACVGIVSWLLALVWILVAICKR